MALEEAGRLTMSARLGQQGFQPEQYIRPTRVPPVELSVDPCRTLHFPRRLKGLAPFQRLLDLGHSSSNRSHIENGDDYVDLAARSPHDVCHPARVPYSAPEGAKASSISDSKYRRIRS